MSIPPPKTELDKLVRYFPDQEWSYYSLSANPNISWGTVQATPGRGWDLILLSNNPSIIYDKSTPPEALEFLNLQPKIKGDRRFELARYNKIFNGNFSPGYVRLTDVLQEEDVYIQSYEYSRRVLFTPEEFDQHIHLPWNWEGLSHNPCITIEIVNKYPDKPWEWGLLASNSNMTVDIILSHPQLKTQTDGIIKNPNVSIQDFLDHSELGLKSDEMYPEIELDFDPLFRKVRKLPQRWWKDPQYTDQKREFDKLLALPLVWEIVTRNPSVLIQDIALNSFLPWEKEFMNPNITLEFVLERKIECDWQVLSRGYFRLHPDLRRLHINRLRKIRSRVRRLGFRGWYRLYLLTKTPGFWRWYCDPGNVGNTVDKMRIERTFESKNNSYCIIKNDYYP